MKVGCAELGDDVGMDLWSRGHCDVSRVFLCKCAMMGRGILRQGQGVCGRSSAVRNCQLRTEGQNKLDSHVITYQTGRARLTSPVWYPPPSDTYSLIRSTYTLLYQSNVQFAHAATT